ncbi:hypothetical protein TUM20983_16070 [Mycobacterium antarcticum]|uniref:hypothetical protein n=1 Tax=Mycolicibacterium sp. TUM20983 TaxID=3023369 RepID=UPI00238BF107|nr:hypothetical protein [Mycolicibacterium sp. TUM20983]GLP74497.1 hypothetical protein TUM20983_16070 [Mycolicibacterium sp. TUM20983]
MATTARAAAPVLSAILAVAAMLFAPTANAAGMRIGNYVVLTDRWNDHSWIWSITHSCKNDPECGTYFVDPIIAPATDNLNVLAIPRPPKSQKFQNTAFYDNGRYTLTVDVIDGVRCIGFNLPSHDVYSWDATTLGGTIVSTYDAGCYGAPAGTSTYSFSLQRY